MRLVGLVTLFFIYLTACNNINISDEQVLNLFDDWVKENHEQFAYWSTKKNKAVFAHQPKIHSTAFDKDGNKIYAIQFSVQSAKNIQIRKWATMYFIPHLTDSKELKLKFLRWGASTSEI